MFSQRQLVVLGTLTLTLGGSYLMAASNVAAPLLAAAEAAFDWGNCNASAQAMRRADREDAQADYWAHLALGVNDTSRPIWHYLREAAQMKREALDEAQEIYEARVDACTLLGEHSYDPRIDPREFSNQVTNTYLPLVPGRTLFYEKTSPEGVERIAFEVLHKTQEIAGVDCVVVRDFVTVDGEPLEDTMDWFAQHRSGDVWYMGEISQNFEDGLLDNLDGSWKTGKEGAKPGVVMRAAPIVGEAYRQEFFLGEAEDLARVIATNETVVVPAGTYTNCLQIEEWTTLEPGHIEYKYYAPGVGMVLEVDPASGERLELVRIKG